jgi:hypothetical protein
MNYIHKLYTLLNSNTWNYFQKQPMGRPKWHQDLAKTILINARSSTSTTAWLKKICRGVIYLPVALLANSFFNKQTSLSVSSASTRKENSEPLSIKDKSLEPAQVDDNTSIISEDDLEKFLKAAREGNLKLIQSHSEKMDYNFKLAIMKEAAKLKQDDIVRFFLDENILEKRFILRRVAASDNLPLLKDILQKEEYVSSTADKIICDAAEADNTQTVIYLVQQGARVDFAFRIAVRQQNNELIKALKDHPKLTSEGIKEALDAAVMPYKPINNQFNMLEPDQKMIEELLKDTRLSGVDIDHILKNPFMPESARSQLLQSPHVSSKGINNYLSGAFIGYVSPFGMINMPMNKYEALTKHPKSDENTVLLVLFYAINNLSTEVIQRQFKDPRITLDGLQRLLKDLDSKKRPWCEARQSNEPEVQKRVKKIERLIENKRAELISPNNPYVIII